LFTIDKMINKNTTLSVQFHNPIDTDSIEIQYRCSLHTKHWQLISLACYMHFK